MQFGEFGCIHVVLAMPPVIYPISINLLAFYHECLACIADRNLPANKSIVGSLALFICYQTGDPFFAFLKSL